MSIQRIPKLFFQKSKDRLPQYIHDMIRHYLTDEWEYINYVNGDEIPFFENHPLAEFPDIINIFNSLKRGEHKCDLFRYYHLFVKGGVYIDSDAMIYQPIDEIVKDYEFFSVKSWVSNCISNCVIASEKGHPIIYEALKRMYQMDPNVLDTDYNYICKELYTIFYSFKEIKSNYVLFKEVEDVTGDNIVDSENNIVFRHFWRNKENIPNHLKSKNLVYCCVFYNKDYFKLLDLLLKSLKMYSQIDKFDFLVVTQKEFEPMVKEFGRKLGIDLKTFCLDFTTIFQAACARLFIFDYPEISGYERILYLDTDIIIKGDLTLIFQLPMRDLLHGLESGTIESLNFGAQFFNFEKVPKSQTGLNSGTLLFFNSETIQNLFGRMREHIETFTKEGHNPPYCMDQPFINFHAIKDSLFDNQLLNPLVSLFEGNDTVDNYLTSSICHFAFPIGNFGHKFHRMKEFFSKTLNRELQTETIYDIIGNKYSWNSGYIKFIVNNKSIYILETTWGKGLFTILDSFTVCAYWNNYYHVLKFNQDYTQYFSIRTYPRDFELSHGSLIPSPLNIYGDSHALVSFDNLKLDHRNLFQFSRTMYRVGRDNHIINFKPNHISKDRIFCFIYGEVDVRCHIGKQVNYGRHHESVCKELVDSYIQAIKNNVLEYKAIIIVAISPPTAENDHKPCNIHTEATGGPLPFVVDDVGRVIYRNRMNELLQEACSQNGFVFFNPYDFYTRPNGTLNYELSDTCIHIGNNKHFLEEFYKLYGTLNH